MNEKYNEKYERQIVELTDNRLKTKLYKVFDYQARIVTRSDLPELKASNMTDTEKCLIMTNKDGETIVITREFETMLLNALKNRT